LTPDHRDEWIRRRKVVDARHRYCALSMPITPRGESTIMMPHLISRLSPWINSAAIIAGLFASSLGSAAPVALASTPADLTLSIIQSPSGPIGLGETVEFTYTMRNIGGTDVNAEMLGGITGAASSSIKTQPDGLQTPCTQARIQLQCTDFILAAGATKT